jgi:predicted metal-dependent hydrolase
MKVHLIQNNSKYIKCELCKRRNSKNISIRVNKSGIVKVTLPYYIPYIAAKNFINKNIDWIEKKLTLFNLQKNTYYYLGENIRLIKKNQTDIKGFNYNFYDNNLIVETDNHYYSEEDLFFEWLKARANAYIPNKVDEFSRKYGFNYNKVTIKNLTSRWGSCSNKKNLSFNLKLMYFKHEVIDYVVVHELCHLKEMNHSKKFWELVEEIIPNHKEYRKTLNKLYHS